MMQVMGLTRLLNHLSDGREPEDISMDTWNAIWEGDEEDPVREITRRYCMEFGWERNELIEFIRETLQQRAKVRECEVTGLHVAGMGDIVCQRCGVELSLEEGLRAQGLKVTADLTPMLPPSPIDEERVAEAIRVADDVMDKLFSRNNITVPREMLGLPPADPEPPSYAIVDLPWGWWGLMNVRAGTVVVKVHGAGAREDIVERWNAKTAVWMAWKERNS